MMWTRSMLKSNAKDVLRRTYWLSFAVVLVSGLLAGGSSAYKITSEYMVNDIEILPGFIMTGSILVFAYITFIGEPLLAGTCYFFMRSRQYDTKFIDMFKGLTNGSYFHTVGVLLVRQLFIFLWTLLLFVPGLIKSFEYYFVPYIIMENPDIPRKRVFELSKEMTNGYKWDIFLLELSFLGWFLLGILSCGIGIVFVTPYLEATKAELYAAQRAFVLQSGVSNETELCGFSNKMI